MHVRTNEGSKSTHGVGGVDVQNTRFEKNMRMKIGWVEDQICRKKKNTGLKVGWSNDKIMYEKIDLVSKIFLHVVP